VFVNVGVVVGVFVNVGVGVGVFVAVDVIVGVGVGINEQYSHEEYNWNILVTFEFEEMFESSLSYVTHMLLPLIDANIVIPIVTGIPLNDKLSLVYNSLPVEQSTRTLTDTHVNDSSNIVNET
jgi:hypothetical protein